MVIFEGLHDLPQDRPYPKFDSAGDQYSLRAAAATKTSNASVRGMLRGAAELQEYASAFSAVLLLARLRQSAAAKQFGRSIPSLARNVAAYHFAERTGAS